jgi:hypothetical protein
MEAASDSSQTERNCTLLITSFSLITFARIEPYINQQQPEKKEQKRKKWKNNEKKLLKD